MELEIIFNSFIPRLFLIVLYPDYFVFRAYNWWREFGEAYRPFNYCYFVILIYETVFCFWYPFILVVSPWYLLIYLPFYFKIKKDHVEAGMQIVLLTLHPFLPPCCDHLIIRMPVSFFLWQFYMHKPNNCDSDIQIVFLLLPYQKNHMDSI